MSRFFAAGSDSESETESSDEDLAPAPVAGGRNVVARSAFQFSDDEEDLKRVVRSAKDKRSDELKSIMKQLKNHKKIKDMSKVLSSFEELTKSFAKAKSVIEQDGATPRFYIRCLAELDDFINECWEDRDARKAMSKNNSKSLSTLRQKLRKYNRDFETDIGAYRENPEETAEEKSEEEDDNEELGTESESDLEDGVIPAANFLKKEAKAAKRAPKADEESESDDSYWGEDSDSDLSSSSDDEKYGGNLAAKFLKKTGEEAEKKEQKKRERKEQREQKKKRRKEEDEDEEEEEEGWEKIPMHSKEKPKMFAKDAEINHPAVVKKLNEILTARGKKSTDRNEQIEMLVELRRIASEHNLGPAMDIKLLFNVIAAIYDYNPNVSSSMRPEKWQKCLDYVNQLLDILGNNAQIVVGEHVSDDTENVEDAENYRVRGCILTVIERMDEEFMKILQASDAHSTEYVERLKDETVVTKTIQRLQKHLESRANTPELCRIYMKRIEHIYYKVDYNKLKKKEEEKENNVVEQEDPFKEEERKTEASEETSETAEEKKEETVEEEEDAEELMETLCKFIYAKDTTDRIRTRAMLAHIYHHALHGRWFQARDLMLMSHLQDTIVHSDIPTQILYNRTMVQLGLCGFRHGMIRDAHNALLDIQSGGRAKELLAQGLLMQRQHERNPEQEKIEKRRQMPFHMHINLELLECVYLVSAMLLEVPYMAAHEFDHTRKRLISKSFHHQLKMSERQALVGPPETMREHVVAASKSMKNGDWRGCLNYIINDKMNLKVWDLFPEKDRVRALLKSKIQEESLRTYLFTYSSAYDSLSLDTLSAQFELDMPTVHGIISKMIINEELMASLDEPTQSVMMHRSEPTHLQYMALQLSDKLACLVENNERAMEMKQGNYFQPSKDRGGQDQQRNYRYRQGGYDNRQDRGGDNRRTGYMDRRGGGSDRYGSQGGDRRGGDRYNQGGGGWNQRTGRRNWKQGWNN